MPRLVQGNRPGLMPCIDDELVAKHMTVDGLAPGRQQSAYGQSRTLLDVCSDDAFLPPPATPATHDDPVGFTEMIEF